MRQLMFGVVVLGVIGAGGGRAQAWHYGHTGPYAQTAAFPLANPPGWYTNTYSFAWHYPWFAYYNYSHGPYANWMTGGGYATYSTYTGHPVEYRPYLGAGASAYGAAAVSATGTAAAGTVIITLPADAKLLFNGTAAAGTGATRTFTTTPLQPGVDYAYDLTSEVVVDGKAVVTKKRVIVRSGEKAVVDLLPKSGN